MESLGVRTQTLGRRDLLRSLGVGSAALLVGNVLDGCSATKPTVQHGQTVVLWQVEEDLAPFYNSTTKQLISESLTASFYPNNRGITVQLYAPEPPTEYPPTGAIPAILAGKGPDIVSVDGNLATDAFLGESLLADLRPFVGSSKVKLTDYDTSQLTLVNLSNGLFALPYTFATGTMVVNLDVFDTAGISYPPNDWSYEEWAAAAKQVTNRPTVYGTTFPQGDWIVPRFAYHGWGGSIVDPQNTARCVVDSQESIACAQFFVELIASGVAAHQWANASAVAAGTQATGFAWLGYLPEYALAWQSVKFRFYPMPAWPQGPYTQTRPNYYGITVESKHKDAAWALLDWLCVQPDWQRAKMSFALSPPSLKSLWPEYIALLPTVAPVFVGTNIEAFQTLILNDRALVGTNFMYDDATARGMLTAASQEVLSGKVDVAVAAQSVAAQVNAMEQLGAGRASEVSRVNGLFPSSGSSAVSGS